MSLAQKFRNKYNLHLIYLYDAWVCSADIEDKTADRTSKEIETELTAARQQAQQVISDTDTT